MRPSWCPRVPVWLVLAASSFLALACGGETIPSRWRDRPITVDGSSVEWEGAVRYIPKQRVSVGAMNDVDALYLTFSTADTRTAMQVLFRGFTVWLNPKSGDRLGVHFPLGREDKRGDGDEDSGGAGSGEGSEGRHRPGGAFDSESGPDLARVVMAYRGPDTEMEILGKDEPRRMPIGNGDGIQVSIDSVNGVLVYELRVPLGTGGDDGMVLNAAPGTAVGVHLEAAGVPFEGRSPQGRSFGGDTDGDDGGFSGRPTGGGRPGGMGPGMGPGPPGVVETLDTTFKLHLATAP